MYVVLSTVIILAIFSFTNELVMHMYVTLEKSLFQSRLHLLLVTVQVIVITYQKIFLNYMLFFTDILSPHLLRDIII